MSNRLTFSLASLVLILGLVLVAVPAMAQVPVDWELNTQGVQLLADTHIVLGREGEQSDAGLPRALPAGDYYTISTLPDLDDFFNRVGGTILMSASTTPTGGSDGAPDFMFDPDGDATTDNSRDLKPGDLYITEIMWGINEAKAGTEDAKNQQWIEIWNNTGQAIPAEAISGLKFQFSYGRPAPANDDLAATDVAAGRVLLDRVSNVTGNGWVLDLGQSGSDASDPEATPEPIVDENKTPFISMYRDSKADRGRQYGDGAAKGSWKQSTETYLSNYFGTPGAAERSGPQTFSASGVALTVVFNEIANFGSGDAAYEWIELRVISGTPNFEKWRVHIVEDVDKQTELFTIPKLDTSRFDDILLITKTDPAGDPNHPLAAGYNVELDDISQNSGIDRNIRYYVADNPGGIGSAWTKDLPDDGEFVLILRHGNDKTDHNKVEDLAGYHPDLTKNTDTFSSNLWPLIGFDAPKFTRNKLEDGAVYRRQKTDIPGTKSGNGKDEKDHTAFRGAPDNDNGYKGVGYKRGADSNAQNGGTPGYSNGAVKEKESDLADGMVSISEIMFDPGNRLPQWIELYNGSKTQAVNLNEWKLMIETDVNDNDVDIRKPSVTIQFGGTIIPPMQTVLLTSAKAGQSSGEINVAHRIIDFWTTSAIKDKLEVAAAGRRYQLLSTMGFKLTLMQKGGTVVDVAGNLGADPAWDLPMDEDADGRVSIIRRFTKYEAGEIVAKGLDTDGTMASSWRLASDTNLQYEVTYYGNSDDMGTPGYRAAGGVLPVSLSKFRPERMKDTGQIVIRWVTESELNNAGFNILRSEKRDGEFTKLNTKLIAGHGTTSERHTYEYADTSAKPNVVYYYQIQDVSLEGQVNTLATTHLRGNVSAAGKLTTTWGELKALQ